MSAGVGFLGDRETNHLKTSLRRNPRALLWIVVLFVLFGTPFLSLGCFSHSAQASLLEVEPGSYHAVHIGLYGFGAIEYSFSGPSGVMDLYLVEVDRRNFDRLADGLSYSYSGYQSVGGGSGRSTMVGIMWELYLVVVNDGTSPAVVSFEVESRSYFNLAAAGLIFAPSVCVAFALYRSSLTKEEIDARRLVTEEARRLRAVALAAIVALVILAGLVMVGLGYLVPANLYILAGSPFYRMELGVLVAVAVAFSLRFKLCVVRLAPRNALSDLAHRLRVSGYQVTEKYNHIYVRITQYASVNVRVRAGSHGTQMVYQASATPTGWGLVLVLLLLGLTSPVALLIVLFSLYRSALFAGTRLVPRLSGLPIAAHGGRVEETRAVLIDSLSEGRRLSSEAYDAARSNYEDALILAWLTVISASVLVGALVATRWLLVGIASGIVGSLALSILSWMMLRARSKPSIDSLSSWKSKFDAAISRELGQRPASDLEPSAFELVADSVKEVPAWLRILRKSGMYRQPIQWFLIIVFVLMGGSLLSGAIADILRGNPTNASLLLAVSAGFWGSAGLLYYFWKREADKEYKDTIQEWAVRYDALRTEMEKFLGSV